MNNKNANFNAKTSKESNGRIRKVKNTCNVLGKPLKRDEKPWRVKYRISLTLRSYVLYQSLRFYTMFFFPKTYQFSSLSYLDSYLSFHLCPNCSATCSFYSRRNVVRHIGIGVKLSFSHLNTNTALYYAMAGGERKSINVKVVG